MATRRRVVWLQSKDKVTVRVDHDVMEQSMVIKTMLESIGNGLINRQNPIPIIEVNEYVLREVIKWCKRHRSDRPSTSEESVRAIDIDRWDQTFLEKNHEILFELINAANYLEIKSLLDAGCKAVADMVAGKSPEQIRQIFGTH